jgi:hypothetical protein
MWLVKTCVWAFCVSVFGAKEKVRIYSPNMGMQSYVRVSVNCGTCKASGNNKEYPSQKMMRDVDGLVWKLMQKYVRDVDGLIWKLMQKYVRDVDGLIWKLTQTYVRC